jgi:aminomethyltransferase|tara:strand:+ start:4765 stop:5850 length:1086 start_codon:yes stop_codon:yes gene_type:complete
MKKTKLYDSHIKYGAKLVPFAGYLMPVQYEGINIEHLNVRQNVGLFDVSHMGEFILEGDQSLNLLQLICSNDVSIIADGKAQYNCLVNELGGIVDDLIIYKFHNKKFMLVVNAANIDKDWDWITHYNKGFNNELKNISNTTSLLALQGPKSYDVLQKLVSFDVKTLEYYSFVNVDFDCFKDVIVSTTGYTGSGGFEIYCKNDDVKLMWELLFEAGKEFGIKPIGLAARDTLRLEMGYCLYGNDINDLTNPIEAGLKWITKTNKNFIGKEKIIDVLENGINKKLIGFKIKERGIPRAGYKIFDQEENEIGVVTSGTMSPCLKKGIGLGYVNTTNSKIETTILIEIRNKKLEAHVVKLPFVIT